MNPCTGGAGRIPMPPRGAKPPLPGANEWGAKGRDPIECGAKEWGANEWGAEAAGVPEKPPPLGAVRCAQAGKASVATIAATAARRLMTPFYA